MRADRTIILSWLGDLASSIVSDADDAADVAKRISDAPGLDASTFASEILSLMRVIAESVDDPADFDRITLPVATGDTADALSILSALGLAIAGCRPDWPSRQRARAARSRIATAGEAANGAISKLGGDGIDLYAWITGLVAVSCRLISDIAADAAPILKISTGISQPSTVLAYQLYGDATRAGALVDVAGSATPLVMPTLFDALAS